MGVMLTARQIRGPALFVGAIILSLLAYGYYEQRACWCISTTEVAHLFVEQFAPPALQRFKADVGRYPTSREGLRALILAPTDLSARWKGPYLYSDEVPKDPWGREYRYRPVGVSGFEIYSLGPDGRISDDDVVLLEKPKA